MRNRKSEKNNKPLSPEVLSVLEDLSEDPNSLLKSLRYFYDHCFLDQENNITDTDHLNYRALERLAA